MISTRNDVTHPRLGPSHDQFPAHNPRSIRSSRRSEKPAPRPYLPSGCLHELGESASRRVRSLPAPIDAYASDSTTLLCCEFTGLDAAPLLKFVDGRGRHVRCSVRVLRSVPHVWIALVCMGPTSRRSDPSCVLRSCLRSTPRPVLASIRLEALSFCPNGFSQGRRSCAVCASLSAPCSRAPSIAWGSSWLYLGEVAPSGFVLVDHP